MTGPRRRRRRGPVLPRRDGVDAARVRMPALPGPQNPAFTPAGSPPTDWSTVAEFLIERTGDAAGVRERIERGEVVLDDGSRVSLETPYRPGAVHLYRDLPPEVPVPFELGVLHRDDEQGLLVVDKPPFLATTPRGGHVTETVIVRARRQWGLADVAAAHRLDRLTAGVLLLTTRPQVRGAYQSMFAQGAVTKTYQALAPVDDRYREPVTVAHHLMKPRGSLRTLVVPGEPNAITTVQLLREVDLPDGRWGLYELKPTTGRTHQLRAQMAAVGLPLRHDPLYPRVRPEPEDFARRLGLLAATVELDDPLIGTPLTWSSRQVLVE